MPNPKPTMQGNLGTPFQAEISADQSERNLGGEKCNAAAGGDPIRTLWSQSSTPHTQDAIWRRRTRWLA